jgi:hypothetical protein
MYVLGFRIQGSGFNVERLGFVPHHSGSMVQGLRFMVQG